MWSTAIYPTLPNTEEREREKEIVTKQHYHSYILLYRSTSSSEERWKS
jgi:hypothetical protein